MKAKGKTKITIAEVKFMTRTANALKLTIKNEDILKD
jgi:hypothetical protein